MRKKRSDLLKRIVGPYFILLFLLMSAILITGYFVAVKWVKNSATENKAQLAEKTALQTDEFIDELDLLSEQVKHSTKIINFFYNLQNDSDRSNYFDTDVLNSIDISSELKNLIVSRAADFNITLYNNLGDFVCSQEYLTNRKGIESMLSSEHYDRMLNHLAENNGMFIVGPENNPWTNSREKYITMVKALQNNYSNNVCGLIEVRCSVSKFAQEVGLGYDGSTLLLDSSGAVMYPIDYEADMSQTEYLRAGMSKVPWEVALKAPDSSEYRFNLPLILIFATLYVVMIFTTFSVATVIGKSITKPIREIAQRVKTINSPEEAIEPFNDSAIDEVKELGDSFEKMLARLNHSISQEKKAYAVALQAQMNPHFLYNTLSVIGAAGDEAGCDNISDMCIRLSDMLRYVAAYQDVTVPLKDEIAHTKNYLSLMKSRYENFFTYTIDIDEELMNIPFPKLFIQPLSENCFKHGFKKTAPPWNIEIEMKGNKDRWELTVRDNGSGITPERIIEVKNKVSNALSETIMGDMGGVGILNTIVRLKMTHNKNIRYEIFNDNGMVIKIIAGE